MRICLYTDTALPKIGGQELVVDALARQFTALGHRAVVLAPRRRSHGSLDRSSLPYAVEWHPRFLSTRWGVAWYRWWLQRLHRRERFDVVHCHSVYPTGYVAACCSSLAGVPVVITSHGGDMAPGSLYDRKPALRPRYSMALERADAAVAISRFTHDNYLAACPQLRHVESIPNGVDLQRFAAPAERPAGLDPAIRPGEYLLFLGRLERRKGVDVLLDAMAAAGIENEFRLVIAGIGPERYTLEAQAASLGLGERVSFIGQADGNAKTYLLQQSRCVLVPSRDWEAFPLVVLESYAAGRPVVGTRIPGLSEIVWPDRTGFLVPSESPRELAEALRRIVQMPNDVQRWGEAAREIARQYDWSVIAQRYLACFESCIAKIGLRQMAK